MRSFRVGQRAARRLEGRYRIWGQSAPLRLSMLPVWAGSLADARRAEALFIRWTQPPTQRAAHGSNGLRWRSRGSRPWPRFRRRLAVAEETRCNVSLLPVHTPLRPHAGMQLWSTWADAVAWLRHTRGMREREVVGQLHGVRRLQHINDVTH